MKKRNHTCLKPFLYCCGFLLCFSAASTTEAFPAEQTDIALSDLEQNRELLRLRIRYGEDFTFARALPDAPVSSDTEAGGGLRPSVLLPLSACRLLPGCPLPEQVKDIETLEQRLTALTQSYSGNWSVYVKNLTTDESFSIQDVPMKSASVMKLFILGTVYEAMENGELERTSEITDLITSMICDSSNEASNRLLSILGDGSYADGIAKVNSYIDRSGYSSSTHEYNGFDNSDTICDPDHFNQVSARDCGELLERIYHREIFSRQICNEIESLMLNQHTRYKIPAGLPEGVETGNKTGEMDTVENDVAVIYGTYGDYILCVLSNDWNSKDEAISHIQEISSIVYDFFDDASYYQDSAPDSFSLLYRLFMEEQAAAASTDSDSIPEYVLVPDDTQEDVQYVIHPGDTEDDAADDSLPLLIRDAESGSLYRVFVDNTEKETEAEAEEESEPSASEENALEIGQAFPVLELPQ